MNDSQHTLTPELQQTICAYIRAGSFPQIAAEAAGIPQKVFDRWMRFGQAARPVPLYRDFVLAVRQAQAQARLLAENRALELSPLIWLKSGPGKETTRMPGWTSPVRPPTPTRKSAGLSSQRLQELISCLLTALSPFPEARLAAAEMLAQGGWMIDPTSDGSEAASLPSPGEQSNNNPDIPPQAREQGEPPAAATECADELAPCALDLDTAASVPQPIQRAEVCQPLATGNESKDEAASSPAAQRQESGPQAAETTAHPDRNEATCNRQRTDKQTTSPAAAAAAPPPPSRPRAWDALDAGHWIVFSSS